MELNGKMFITLNRAEITPEAIEGIKTKLNQAFDVKKEEIIIVNEDDSREKTIIIKFKYK